MMKGFCTFNAWLILETHTRFYDSVCRKRAQIESDWVAVIAATLCMNDGPSDSKKEACKTNVGAELSIEGRLLEEENGV